MSEARRISVVIPCFNREARIGKAIESALHQSVPPFEVIVVDDGSRDESAARAESFGDPVRVIRTENRGPSPARNRGLDEARGDWVAFLDSDDEWTKDKLARQLEALQEFPKARLVFSDTRTLVGGEVDIPSRFDLGGVRDAAVEVSGPSLRFDRSIFVRLLGESRIFTSAVLVEKGIEGLRFPEEFKGPEDWALWMTLALRHEFAAVDSVDVDMHYDGDNLTATYAPILGRGVSVLEKLLQVEKLSWDEQVAVEVALSARRAGALYHSLIEGHGARARRLLGDTPKRELGLVRWWSYWGASFLPDGVREWIVRNRTFSR